MRETGGTVLLMLVLLAAGFAGCIGEGTDTGTGTDQGAPDEGAPETTHQPNGFLLEAPRPYTTTVSSGAEPMILADQGGEYLLIGDTAGVHRSTDRGKTWSTTNPFPILADGISLAQDDTGTIYGTTTSIPTIMVASSSNGGASFGVPTLAADVSPVADRPWIDARGDGELALIHFDFGRSFQEYCLHSMDGHEVFEDRQVRPLQTVPNAGNVVFDDEGAIYWGIGGEIWKRQRLEVEDQAILCNTATADRRVISSVGAQVFTQVATDGQAVYAAAPSQDNGELRIGATRNFVTTTEVALLPTDGQNELATNTFLAISVTDTEVAVAWYGSETPGDPTHPDFDGSWNVFVAQISNFWDHDGATLACTHADVTCTRITDEPNHVGDICMSGTGCGTGNDRDLLDYFGIDHGPDGALHVAYGHDGESSNAETRYACVGAACDPDNLAPIPDFSVTCQHLACTLDASATTDPDGDTLTYHWELGDGTRADGELVHHDYEIGGALTITLHADDGVINATLADLVLVPEGVRLDLEAQEPTYGPDEPARILVTTVDRDTGLGVPGVVVDLTARWDAPGGSAIHQGRTFEVMRTAGLMYHGGQVTTGEDGTAVWEVPGDVEASGMHVSVPTQPTDMLVLGEFGEGDTRNFAKTSYTVGVLG